MKYYILLYIYFDISLGKYVRDDVIFNTIQLVSENSELQPYVAQESWAALKASSDCYSEKQPLTQVPNSSCVLAKN